MQKNIILYLLMVMSLVIQVLHARAQTDPMYTQYIFNTQTYNPAYAGTLENPGIMFLSRHQWLGIDNAPSTQSLSFQSPLGQKNAALGFNMAMDRSGKEKRFGLFGDYSYKVVLKENLLLRLGIKGGFTNYSNDLIGYNLNNPNDFTFQEPAKNKFMPNFGVGAFLYSEKFFLGLASPKLVRSKIEKNIDHSTTAEFRHLFVSSGMTMDLNEWLKFKPAVLLKMAKNVPVQLDISTRFLIRNTLSLGLMYRSFDAWGALAQLYITDQLRFGYAVDFTLTDLRHFHHGTHEIMISYEIRSKKREKALAALNF